ncbi:hypothetical protein AMELA_G00058910, partial [Ameiurus melas]
RVGIPGRSWEEAVPYAGFIASPLSSSSSGAEPSVSGASERERLEKPVLRGFSGNTSSIVSLRSRVGLQSSSCGRASFHPLLLELYWWTSRSRFANQPPARRWWLHPAVTVLPVSVGTGARRRGRSESSSLRVGCRSARTQYLFTGYSCLSPVTEIWRHRWDWHLMRVGADRLTYEPGRRRRTSTVECQACNRGSFRTRDCEGTPAAGMQFCLL